MRGRTTRAGWLFICLVMAGIFPAGCTRPWQPQGLESSFENAPRIVKYGAVDRIKSGQTWRLYVAAEDPNGDMEDIIFEITQPGQGPYPEHDRHLKGDASKAFSGYFYLNTPVGWRDDLWGLELTVRFRVRDKVGYASEMISLPLKFVGRNVEQPIPPGFTKDEDRPLGAILIDLYREDQREPGGADR